MSREVTAINHDPKTGRFVRVFYPVTYNATEAAKILGVSSAQNLNKKLETLGVIVKYCWGWDITRKYEGYGLTGMAETTYSNGCNVKNSKEYMVWTPKGLRFLKTIFH